MNNKRFGGFRQSGLGPRERWMLIGGSVSIVCAIVLITLLVSSKDEADAVQKPVMPVATDGINLGNVELVVPVDPVPEGTKLSTVKTTLMHWPSAQVPEGAVRRDDDVQDLYAKVDLPAKQPILRANLTSVALAGGIADRIPEGHRAVTMEVDATSGVEGWATPGAHVDVLVTFHDPADGKKKTQIVIEDAVVISYNGDTKRTVRDGHRPSQSGTVTLSVEVSDAVKLYTARALGKIGLMLRNSSDRKSVGETVVSVDDFSKRVEAPAPTPVQEAPKGFARFVDKDGKVKELELTNRWQPRAD